MGVAVVGVGVVVVVVVVVKLNMLELKHGGGWTMIFRFNVGDD